MTKLITDFTASSLSGVRFSPADSCLMVIDVQKDFFAFEPSDKTARKINSFAMAARRQGMPVYGVYFNYSIEDAKREYYRFYPAAGDHLVLKSRLSAFQDGVVYTNEKKVGDLADVLHQRGIKNVIVCGGFTEACVGETVKDGLKLSPTIGFCVISNLTTNGDAYDDPQENGDRKHLQQKGALVVPAGDIMRAIKAGKPPGAVS